MEGIEQIALASGIEGLDQRITLWMNSNYAPWSDVFWATISGVKIWIPLYVIVAGLLIWRLGWKKGLIAIAAVALAFFFNERICNLIKDIVQRVRPCNSQTMIAAGIHILSEGGGFSCPSGHACNCMGFALGSAICLKADKSINWNWYSIAIVTWAVLIAISRVMVACHFLGDVILGALIGGTMGVLWAVFALKIFKKVK